MKNCILWHKDSDSFPVTDEDKLDDSLDVQLICWWISGHSTLERASRHFYGSVATTISQEHRKYQTLPGQAWFWPCNGTTWPLWKWPRTMFHGRRTSSILLTSPSPRKRRSLSMELRWEEAAWSRWDPIFPWDNRRWDTHEVKCVEPMLVHAPS